MGNCCITEDIEKKTKINIIKNKEDKFNTPKFHDSLHISDKATFATENQLLRSVCNNEISSDLNIDSTKVNSFRNLNRIYRNMLKN